MSKSVGRSLILPYGIIRIRLLKSFFYQLTIRLGVLTLLSNLASALAFAIVLRAGIGIAVALILSQSAYLTVYIAAAFIDSSRKSSHSSFHRFYFLLASLVIAFQAFFAVIALNFSSNLSVVGILLLLSMSATICTAQFWNVGRSILAADRMSRFKHKIRAITKRVPSKHRPNSN